MMIPMLSELPELSRETIEAIVVCAAVISTSILLGWIVADINDRREEIKNEELAEMLARREEHE